MGEFDPSPSEKDLLRRAVDLARESFDAGGFPVGALLVRDGREISHGLSATGATRDVTAHAEVQAIRAAGAAATRPLTLYSSLEPCLMCVAASAWAGVNRIVFACRRTAVDPTYYESSLGVEEASRLLAAPPELLCFDDFTDEVVRLIKDYEERLRGIDG